MEAQPVKTVKEYELEYGQLCGQLGDLVYRQEINQVTISGLKEKLKQLNQLAAEAYKANETTEKQEPKTEESPVQ